MVQVVILKENITRYFTIFHVCCKGEFPFVFFLEGRGGGGGHKTVQSFTRMQTTKTDDLNGIQ